MSTNCLFCKILEGTITSEKIVENENCIVIRDIQPQAPTHLLCIPKTHVASLNDLTDAQRHSILPTLFQIADEAATKLGFRKNGYRTVFNNQAQAGQTVFHLHLHILTGANLGKFGE